MCSIASKMIFDKLGGKKKDKNKPVVPGAPVVPGVAPIKVPVAPQPGFGAPINRVPLL